MFVLDPLVQGLELLAQKELQRAEVLFLSVINDPYAEVKDSVLARGYLNDIRVCQKGSKNLNFENYRALAKGRPRSLDSIIRFLYDLYFSSNETYNNFDHALALGIPSIISPLKRIKIRDIIARDKLFASIKEKGLKQIRYGTKSPVEGRVSGFFDTFRWKMIFRKFIERVNPILLERHLELLNYILETGEIGLLDDPKLSVLTPKYRWIIESTLKSKWFLLRSYFFKAKSEIHDQFNKKEGTRKYWEEVRYRKIRIFEDCGFQERHIQKFLYSDKLNYKTLQQIYDIAFEMGLKLVPRDVSLALRGIHKAKNHIKERAGFLTGRRKEFQLQLVDLGFSDHSAYEIARLAKGASGYQIVESFKSSLQVARDEIYWYRVAPHSLKLKRDIEDQCRKHLSTVRIHLFERGRLNKLLLKVGKLLIRDYLVKTFGQDVVSLHCYFRLETIHQFYKLKFFQYHGDHIPSVSELIKVSRKDFKALLIDGFQAFLKKKRLKVPGDMLQKIERKKSVTEWEDIHTTPEEKFLLKVWFLMDHGVGLTQRLINKGAMEPGFNLLKLVNIQEGQDCKS